MKIYLASNNKGKIEEIKKFFSNAEIITTNSLKEFQEPEENGTTFEENSMIKAKALYNFIKNNIKKRDIIIADDSGIIIPLLGEDKLGVYTKRQMLSWTSENNCDEKEFWKHIVNKVGEKAEAKFLAVISVIDCEGKEISYTYTLDGTVVYPRGTNGFAFDSIFEYEGKTLAERTIEEKEKISPRGKALEKVAKDFLEFNK